MPKHNPAPMRASDLLPAIGGKTSDALPRRPLSAAFAALLIAPAAPAHERSAGGDHSGGEHGEGDEHAEAGADADESSDSSDTLALVLSVAALALAAAALGLTFASRRRRSP